jgi:hypothetical protein
MPNLDFKMMVTVKQLPKVVTVATALSACDVLVEAVPNGTAPYTVTLPPLGDALYYPYTVYTPTNNTGTVVVASAEGTTLGTMTAAADQLVMLPTATHWILLHDTTT